jgi:hypothetical protein
MLKNASGETRHYGYMLIVLIAIFALFPFVEENNLVRWGLSAAFVALAVAALYSNQEQRWAFRAVVALGTLVLLVDLGGEFGVASLVSWLAASRAGFILLVTVAVAIPLMSSRRITLDTIYGACCVYLLLALVWTNLYLVIDQIYPGSFTVSVGTVEPATLESQMLYFSLITMTTVGYGDITPLSRQAGMMAAMQGVTAQLYVAVVIARLVSMQMVHGKRSGSDAE